MKKSIYYFSIFISMVLLLVMLFPVRNAKAASDYQTLSSGDYTYRLYHTSKEKYIYLESYNGSAENVIVPDAIDSIKVIRVMDQYKHPSQIKSITLPKSIESVDCYCFKDLSNLESIQVDEKNPRFSSEAGILFSNHSQKRKLVFYPAAKKGTSFTVPSDVTNISYAFTNNRYLKKLILNKNMSTTGTLIAEHSNIETIVIPNQTKWIEEQSFENCKKLKTVIGGRNVTIIAKEAFSGCTSLETITLSKRLEKIGRWAFKNCKSLKKLIIPPSVNVIDTSAFQGCKPSLKRESYLKKQKDGSYLAKAIVNVNGKKKEYNAKRISKICTADKHITLKKGRTKKLKTLVYISGKRKGTLDSSLLKYTSYNQRIVKVTSHGNMKALKKGKTTIRVTLKSKSFSYKIKVTVK